MSSCQFCGESLGPNGEHPIGGVQACDEPPEQPPEVPAPEHPYMSMTCVHCGIDAFCPKCDEVTAPGDSAELAAIRYRLNHDPNGITSPDGPRNDRVTLLRMVDELTVENARLTEIDADAEIRLDERSKWIDELRAKLAGLTDWTADEEERHHAREIELEAKLAEAEKLHERQSTTAWGQVTIQRERAEAAEARVNHLKQEVARLEQEVAWRQAQIEGRLR